MDNFTLKLEWAYGYRGSQVRNNLFYNKNGDLVYFLAGIGIVHNVKKGEQKYFYEHNDDILCLSIDQSLTFVASGQIGEEPYVCIWDSTNQKTVSILKDLDHSSGVGIVAFSPDSQLFLSVGIDDKSTIIVWDLKKAKPVARTQENVEKVFDGQFHPSWANTVVTCGLQHIKFWRVCGNVLNTVNEQMKDVQTILCLAFGANGVTFAGGLSGSVYLFQKDKLEGSMNAAHEGGVFCMCQTQDGYISGGRDGELKLWDQKFKPLSTISLPSLLKKDVMIRAVCNQSDKILVGTQDSEIYEIVLRDRDKPKLLVSGHADKALWALAVHPKKPMFATGSDDMSIRIWNSSEHVLLEMTHVIAWVRSLAYSNDGNFLAAGLSDGSITIYKSKDFVEIVKLDKRKRPIHEMKFSPNNEYLAAGCNDGCTDLYVVNQKFKHQAVCQANGNNVIHLDWSEDSKIIQINTGIGERFLYKIPTCKVLNNKDDIKGIKWATWTCVLGPEVEGIWSKNSKMTQISAVDVNVEKKLLASGNQDGIVKLFQFPVFNKAAKNQKFVGHSADVTNVRWSRDGETLVTLGGTDNAILQWRLVPKSNDVHEENKLSKRDSDSDNESVRTAEIDSDVEKATNKSRYKRFVTKERAKKFTRNIIRTELKQEGKKRIGPPSASLELVYAFGYRGYDCFNNIYFSQHGEIIYHIAAVGVVMNRESGQQKFYIGHTDDILCMSIHPQKDIIASGQIGKVPVIHIWDVQTLKAISILKGQHSVGVYAVDFSGDGKRLASVGMDDNHCIVIWDWKKGEKLALARGHKDKIFGLCFNPKDPLKLTSVGVRHIKFWTHAGSGFTSVRGVFGTVAKMDTMLCVTYSNTVDDTCLSGAADGNIYIWVATKLTRTISAHKGPCFAIFALEKGFVTGGKDGQISLWDEKCEKLIKQYPINSKVLSKDSQPLLHDNPVITAATLGHNKIIAGTKNGEIVEADKSGTVLVLMQGHCEGELWGLSPHPTEQSVATASDDGYLRLWSFKESSKKLLSFKKLSKPARSVSINSDGKSIAVGFKDGSVTVLSADTYQALHQFTHRKESISDLKFSPNGKYLAVGSHDNFVDIYDNVSGKRVGIGKGSSSYISHVDWEQSGSFIRSNSGAREELYYQAPSGTREPLSPTDADQYKWASWTGVLGPYCNGIWPPRSDVTDINASCLHPKYPLLVTGDDMGFVKLFNFPAMGKYSKYKNYLGHSAHVTNCRFSTDGLFLFTIGGADTALLMWKVQQDKGFGQSETSDTDSEEDGEYDSDVEWEKKIDYKSKTYSKSQRPSNDNLNPTDHETVAKSKISRKIHEKVNVVRLDTSAFAKNKKRKILTQIGGLKLEYIFGYRGFDCANNLFYINDGSEIIYHAAGAGIVMNLASGQQKFYLEHTDDIISLTINTGPKYETVVATGQIDQTAPIVRVWDFKTLKTLSILKCNFASGPNCLAFSPSGKYLLAVGIDEEHTITIWKWQDGTVIAIAPGNVNRIFDAKFRPDSDQNFVTVGIKHIKFWQICGSEIVGKKGVLTAGSETKEKKTTSTMLSIAFAPDKTTYTGSITGNICIWKDETLIRTIANAHNGPVFCLYTTLSDGLIVSGSKEKKTTPNSGHVKLWDQQMQRCKPFNIQPVSDTKSDIVKSICRHKDKIIVGTKNCDIIEIQEQTGVPHYVLRSHGDGKLLGLCVHPSQDLVASASFDKTVRLWEVSKKSMVTTMRFDNEPICCQFTPDGNLLTVGFKNGEFVIFHSADSTVWAKKRERGSAINEIKFSPDGKWLAVGFDEPAVDVYDISQGPQLQKICYIKAMQDAVRHMDFSSDGHYLRVANKKLGTFVFHLPDSINLTDQSKIDEIIWATWTSVCGKEIVGIWSENWRETEINCADVAHVNNVIATGDDSGFVRLFKFPCSDKNAPCEQYIGHSAHVSKVRFTFDDTYLISAGGEDSCLFVWRCQEGVS